MKEIIKKFIPSFLLSWYHFLLAFLGAIIYRFPSKARTKRRAGDEGKLQRRQTSSMKLKVIGVTGTNGKTTTTEMIAKILEEAGYKVALINSIRFKIGDKEEPNMLKVTTPGRFKIQSFLREAINAGCQYAVLEVTSEGILQHRQRFIDFQVAVFTNLTPEHIERHGGFENYRAAKGKLFQATKNIHIINIDDKNSNFFLKFPAKKKYTYGLNQGDVNNKNLQFNLKLPGEFNLYNALAATCVGLSQGISLEFSKKVIESIEGIPGRMEEVISQPFKVVVDYAFTPNALEKVYQTLKPKEKRMICVLGAAGGGRDKWKRPVLGEIAAKYCNEVIVTNEDPYDEDPMEIINQVASGAEKTNLNPPNQHKSAVHKILDRREAIRKALRLAKPGDVVIITGKGCEPWICLAGEKKIPWDDREIVREEFQRLNLTRESL